MNSHIGTQICSTGVGIAGIPEVKIRGMGNKMGTMVGRRVIEVVQADVRHAFAEPTIQTRYRYHREPPLQKWAPKNQEGRWGAEASHLCFRQDSIYGAGTA